MTAQFIGDLNTRFLDEPIDKTKWFMTTSVFWYCTEKGVLIPIPTGTPTDFASIPIGFRNLISRFGRHGKAAVLHDYLCTSKIVSRKEADMIFLEAMKILRVKKWKRKVMFVGVRGYSIVTGKK